MKRFGLIAVFAGFGIGCWERHRTPCVYEVPDGFRGWILIESGRKECPTIQTENGKHIFKIPASGRLCVSDSLEAGVAKDEFYFVGRQRTLISDDTSGEEGLPRVRGGGVGGPGSRTFLHYFVGTEEELKQQPLMELFERVRTESGPPA